MSELARLQVLQHRDIKLQCGSPKKKKATVWLMVMLNLVLGCGVQAHCMFWSWPIGVVGIGRCSFLRFITLNKQYSMSDCSEMYTVIGAMEFIYLFPNWLHLSFGLKYMPLYSDTTPTNIFSVLY